MRDHNAAMRANADLQQIKTHRFRHGVYRLNWRRPGSHENDGECDAPTTSGKGIVINPALAPKRLLTVMLDEGIHACCWDLDNEVVDEMSGVLAEFLWRCGYRRVPPTER